MFTAEVTYTNGKTKSIKNVTSAFLIDFNDVRHPLEMPCENYSSFQPGFSASSNVEIKGAFFLVTDTEEISFPLKTARKLTVRQS